ncbi:pumilio 7 [Actinidia rufa]|uniref:Pumilio 7 n=1 Tax=Actinidia rufa TaxID=165716 RepID=A0A7J0FCJ4_9ERIC|nr:pumilio 7 [Actinidia rufa]
MFKEKQSEMRSDGELEMFLREIPHMSSLDRNLQNNHHLLMGFSPSSSSFSGGFSSSDEDPDGFQSSIPRNSMSSDDAVKAKLVGFCEEYNADHLMRSHLTHNQFRPLYSEPPSCYKDVEYVMDQRELQGRGYCNGGLKLQNPSMNRPHLDDESCFSQRRGTDFFGSGRLLNPGCNRSHGLKKKSRNEKTMQNGGEKQKDLCGQLQLQGFCENGPSLGSYSPLLLQPPCSNSLAQFRGSIYFMVQNQAGCRFLQRIFDEGTPQDVQIIFNEVVNHVVELMLNPFGNYLMQKLLEVCSEEQRLHIVLMVTEVPGDLIRISLSTHGTRVVQKLIETLKTTQQILLVTLALKPGFLDLIKDPNGNHVIQRCLQCLSTEDNKFIFDGAAKFCVDIATHKHGCCVLNRCITQAVGKYREKLLAEIVAHGFHLAQDAFGNYVVQYIIELKVPSATASLISQFEGHFVYLSMQKFGSHVVEKCLKCCEKNRPRIIHELLSVPHFEQLLQDPFANYVIQSALEVSQVNQRCSHVMLP